MAWIPHDSVVNLVTGLSKGVCGLEGQVCSCPVSDAGELFSFKSCSCCCQTAQKSCTDGGNNRVFFRKILKATQEVIFFAQSAILAFSLCDALIYLLWFIWLIAFVAKKTFFVLPLLIWIPKDPVSTSFLRFDLQEGHRGSPVLPSPQTRLQYISVYIDICVEEYIHTYISLIQWIYCVNMLLRQIPYLIYTSQMGGMSLLQCLVREAFGIKIPVGWLLRAAAGLQG